MFSMQVIACINMLGLNNELYRSHVELKRHLVNFLFKILNILLHPADQSYLASQVKAPIICLSPSGTNDADWMHH